MAATRMQSQHFLIVVECPRPRLFPWVCLAASILSFIGSWVYVSARVGQ